MLVKQYFLVKDGLALEAGEWLVLVLHPVVLACRHDTKNET